MLYPTPSLSRDDERVLASIDEMYSALRDQVRAMPSRQVQRLCTFLTADAVAASTSIEGFKVATVDVEDLIEGEQDVEVSEENREETLALHRMMTYIHTLHDSADFTYSKSFLNALHWMLQGHRHHPRKPAGQWRRGPVYVTDARDPSIAAYTAPDAEAVPALMHELVDWLGTDDHAHPLVRAAMAHLHLVSIHPWADGNGRMSRSLQTLLIAREGVLAPEFSSIEAWLGRPGNTWEYYRELARRGPQYLPDQDVAGWIRFNLTAYHQQAQTVQGRLTRAGKVWEALADFAQHAGLDERTITALHDVAMAGRVRRSRYESAEGLSLQQAQRDLRDLVTAHVLTPVGRTRARYYTAGDRFPQQALDISATPMTLTDPYTPTG
ncbi:Fic family protein [Actinacidiphila glaucinigra]|uniref:Fic family protein n=1 Tax=Actinacidiphila glaucinigra TaxID=235986 RepID=UPI002DDC3B87|nr:Fic family protein [Actinacidiphila glaucinigra]WSD57534.1 Fic family protein [Actinacidiphila glaucinigra]WSD65111.1 Fic family protein [Actinacidiphila glaucinigra]